MTPRRVLFLCSRHRLRSPTAAAVFATWPGLEVDSAGLADDAETPLDPAQLDWAGLIVVMEAQHARYDFMQPELVALLERRVGPLLR